MRVAAVAVARELERRRPDLITAAWWKEERGGRVFVDFNQNAPHKTVFGAWSVRARPGAQVSTPFRWDELAADRPRRAHDRDACRRGSSATATRGPASTTEPQSLEPLLELVDARPRQRPDRRAVAARLPEDGRRTPAGRPSRAKKPA